MEEILASIRRIIADDQGAPRATGQAEVSLEQDGLGVLHDQPALPAESTDAARQDEAEVVPVLEREPIDGARSEPPHEAAAAGHEEPAIIDPAPSEDVGLLSAAAQDAVASAFDALAGTVRASNGRTLEDLMREMLRPMLKAWLDDNLPVIVERIVRAEIERVARGARF